MTTSTNNKQPLHFNNQTWEEITRREYYQDTEEKHMSISIWNGESLDEVLYYRLVPPPETFPKIFGDFKVYEDGFIFDNLVGEWVIGSSNLNQIPNLKLALAESERIRRKE